MIYQTTWTTLTQVQYSFWKNNLQLLTAQLDLLGISGFPIRAFVAPIFFLYAIKLTIAAFPLDKVSLLEIILNSQGQVSLTPTYSQLLSLQVYQSKDGVTRLFRLYFLVLLQTLNDTTLLPRWTEISEEGDSVLSPLGLTGLRQLSATPQGRSNVFYLELELVSALLLLYQLKL